MISNKNVLHYRKRPDIIILLVYTKKLMKILVNGIIGNIIVVSV
jgi:hypothetical protein